ncbi:GLE1-like protein-domain-containing protein [Immersiella caudata]|uniref:mRNA export factor GLE1 n=1 Tax=Immersiella caudata TaxID=314043 RepID=A0AA39X488_9PEZI|nr:GLE1-like protein-domain-containing protein [Immersiella caudata]
MAGSSPGPRRSHQWSSPQRAQVLADLLDDNRNSESRHRHLIEAAKKEHDRVREEAERVILEHQKKEERQRLLEEKRKEEQRIQLEEQIAAERLKLLALKEKKIEIPPAPPAEPKTDPAKSSATSGPVPPPVQTTTTQANGATPQVSPPKQATSNPFAVTPGSLVTAAKPAIAIPGANGAVAKPSSTVAGGSNPFGISTLLNGVAPQPTPAPAPAKAVVSASPPTAWTTIDRYTEIHRNLKALRKSMKEQLTQNKALKARMGDMRREIVKSIGQLTNGVGANRKQQEKIIAMLREALENAPSSSLIDPGMFTLESRSPVAGATHNEDQLPSLFFYLINIFAKATIKQFIVETGANPETADPIGVTIAIVFSNADFHWRGASMIDILMAKFRIVCPVLFGYRGSEKTEQGRARLGWWKDQNGQWIDEQSHMNRMMGIGSGFAAVALRNFGKSTKQNPCPPRHYWTAMARIVNTPPAEISNTQCLVLKAMIENYEPKLLEFYGDAGRAALRAALIEFPARTAQKSPAVNSLEVVATLLKKDTGLALG